ncbi:MAG: hypothetical protein FWF33_01935 [Clostridiales bacterium]|nr:hypothetical protein [Clostridiales bacterium]
MTKKVKIIIAVVCIAVAAALVIGFTQARAPAPSQPPANGGSSQDKPAQGGSADVPDIGAGGSSGTGADMTPEALKTALGGHEMPLKGNPVAGNYIMTSGGTLAIAENGSYIWDERGVGGSLITGTYELYKGTLQKLDDGTSNYITESTTGPVYTLFVTFNQDSSGQSAPFTIQVFDTYSADVFRVTDLVYGMQFEAADATSDAAQQLLWGTKQPQNLALNETDGPAIVATWDTLPGADGYRVAVIQISFADLQTMLQNNQTPPDAVYQGDTASPNMTITQGLEPGKTYTVAVFALQGSVATSPAFQEITLK